MLKSGRPTCSRSGCGSEIGPRLSTAGRGFPATTRLRRYQNPPASSAGTNHQAAAAHLLPIGASTITATLSAAAIANAVTLVPAAKPTASPATASGQPTGNAPDAASPPVPRFLFHGIGGFGTAELDRGLPVDELPRFSQALTRIAIAARVRAAAMRSFFAAPGSRTTSTCASSRIATATTLRSPRPYGLPMHQAAKNATTSHP